MRALRASLWLLILGAAGTLFAQQSPFPLPEPTGAQDYTESPVKPEIAGYVRFPQSIEGQPVRVRLETSTGTILREVWTGKLGYFTFPEVPCGDYVVSTDVSGYRPIRIPVEHSFIPMGSLFLNLVPAESQSEEAAARETGISPTPKARAEYTKGLEALSRKNPGGSMRHFRKAIALAPDYGDAYFQLGWAYYQQRAYGEAQRALEHAVELNRKNAQAYSLLGAVYRQQSRLQDAVLALENSLRLNENSCRTHLELGETLLKAGNLNAAYNHLTRAHGLNPGIAQTHVALYNSLILRNDYQAAITELDEFLNLFPQSPLAARVRQQREALTKVVGAQH